ILVLHTELLTRSRPRRCLDGWELAPRRRFASHLRLWALPSARRLLTRVARLVELDELVLAHRHLWYGFLALEHGIGNAGGIQLDGPHGVIVARNHIIDAVG